MAPQAPSAPVGLFVIDPVQGLQAYPPVHATLLPDGRVMLFGKAGVNTKAAWFVPTAFDQNPPAAIALTIDSIPVDINQQTITDSAGRQWFVDETLFCSGHSLMADGSIFVAGGTLLLSNLDPVTNIRTNFVYGMPNATLYSFPTRSWSRVPGDMLGVGESNLALRWYGAVTRLADTRMLLTSGLDLAVVERIIPGQAEKFLHAGTQNRSVEIYNPDSGFTLVSQDSATPPQAWNPDFTHVFQIPYATTPNLVLMFGQAGVPVFLAPDAPSGSQWAALTTVTRPGTNAGVPPNHGTSSVLPPLRVNNGEWGYANGSVMQVGGEHNSISEQNVDIYELSTNTWLPSIGLGFHRRYPATVLLPDGKLLVVSGHDDEAGSTLVQNAQYLDPRPPTTFTTSATAMGEVRGYHNVALLLPDGRVLVAGGRTAGETSTEDEKPSLRYLYPPYMSPRAAPPPRPVVVSAPATINYGANFSVGVAGSPVSEVVLMGLGSMTHAFDANQRHIQLAIAGSSTGNVQVAGPPNTQTAPPGYYMLFVLNQAHIPSVARFVRVIQ